VVALAITNGTTPGRTTNDRGENADADAAESCSDRAQQLSASAWLTVMNEPGETGLCIGHAAPLEQQAIRASGVDIHPAHKARGLAESDTARRSADRRRLRISTSVG
jgi:hypothetical protein